VKRKGPRVESRGLGVGERSKAMNVSKDKRVTIITQGDHERTGEFCKAKGQWMKM
jgi:hypothetical protein